MSTKQRNDKNPTVPDANERSTDDLSAELDRIIRQMDQVVHDHLSHKPEAIAEWQEIMRDYEEGLAEDQREAEEAKLDREVNEWLDRINADIDRLGSLVPFSIEFDEALTSMFAAWREADAVMRLRCRHYPEKLMKWETDVMGLVNHWEGIVAAGMEAEEAKPAN